MTELPELPELPWFDPENPLADTPELRAHLVRLGIDTGHPDIMAGAGLGYRLACASIVALAEVSCPPPFVQVMRAIGDKAMALAPVLDHIRDRAPDRVEAIDGFDPETARTLYELVRQLGGSAEVSRAALERIQGEVRAQPTSSGGVMLRIGPGTVRGGPEDGATSPADGNGS